MKGPHKERNQQNTRQVGESPTNVQSVRFTAVQYVVKIVLALKLEAPFVLEAPKHVLSVLPGNKSGSVYWKSVN
jgi:hypothetical protein